MKTIALRFGEHFSPKCGTIAAHQEIIDQFTYVWYGKMGNPVAMRVIEELRQQEDMKILLINSGKADRYWAYVADISRETPPLEYIPTYYRNSAEKFRTWFKVIRFEQASKDVMSKCYVSSSNRPLNEVSKKSMSPYYIIEYAEENE